MTVNVTVTWASEQDMLGNKTFIKTRRDKLNEMKDNGKTNGVATIVPGTSAATIVFTSQVDADEWVSYIQGLATEYNKTISSIALN